MIHRVYTAAFAALLLGYAPVALARRVRRGVPLNVRARLGYGWRNGQQELRRTGWVHAVSVGEAIAATPLVTALHERHPDLPLVVSTVTETGARVVRERLAGVAAHRYFPLDLPGPVRRAAAAIDPSFLVCMETELWPNLLRVLGERRVPVMIANGRLSDRSFRRYHLVRALMRRMLGGIAVFAMQSEEDARRIVALGARPERVVVTGNIKHDAPPDAGAGAEWWRTLIGLGREQRLWVAGSTHRGEEEAVLEAHAAARLDDGALGLVIAPRHPERVPEVLALVRSRGWAAVRRSELGSAARPAAGAIVVLDTVGELAQLYGAADVVFVGGSLVPSGGHNMLEAAQRAKPVLFGPHTGNFREAAALLTSAGAALVVADAPHLARELRRLLADGGFRTRLGAAAQAAAAARQGALARTLELVETILPGAPGRSSGFA